MHVGLSLTFLMAQMTKFKLWLRQVSVKDLLNFFCKLLA